MYYSEVGGGSDHHHHGQNQHHHFNVSPSSTVNLGSGHSGHSSTTSLATSASTSSLRRNLSPKSNMTASTTNLSSGGSLKKDQVANLNLLSTTNEAKGEKPEIRQQIPVKLSSKLSVSAGGGKERGTKKLSSVSTTSMRQVKISDPRGRPTVTAGSDQCFCTCRTSIPTFPSNKFQAKAMFATGETVALAEWIIDYTRYLIIYCIIQKHVTLL